MREVKLVAFAFLKWHVCFLFLFIGINEDFGFRMVNRVKA